MFVSLAFRILPGDPRPCQSKPRVSAASCAKSTKQWALSVCEEGRTLDHIATHLMSCATVSSTFNTSDQITTAGYTYDGLGRSRTVPAVHTDQPTGALSDSRSSPSRRLDHRQESNDRLGRVLRSRQERRAARP